MKLHKCNVLFVYENIQFMTVNELYMQGVIIERMFDVRFYYFAL